MNKIAFLCLAYRQPKVLSYFTQAFDDDRYHFFVHVDAKVDLAAFSAGQDFRRTRFIERRQAVYWGGFNMIRATLELARQALDETSAKWFALVSDDTFPLLEPDEFHRSVEAFGDQIHFWRVSEGQVVHRRYSDFYYFDSDQASARHLESEQRHVTPADLNAYIRLHSLMLRGKRPIQLYSGSQWWVLSRESLIRCLDMIDGDPWLKESFEFSAIPDEMVFQTLYRASGCTPPYGPKCPVHTDFEREPKPFVFSSEEEVRRPAIAGRLLIRKVAPDPAFLGRLMKLGSVTLSG